MLLLVFPLLPNSLLTQTFFTFLLSYSCCSCYSSPTFSFFFLPYLSFSFSLIPFFANKFYLHFHLLVSLPQLVPSFSFSITSSPLLLLVISTLPFPLLFLLPNSYRDECGWWLALAESASSLPDSILKLSCIHWLTHTKAFVKVWNTSPCLWPRPALSKSGKHWVQVLWLDIVVPWYCNC